MGAILLLSFVFSTSLLANSSSDRLACYKANKLIPSELTLSTSGAANTDQVYIFTSASRTWATGTTLESMVAQYGEFTSDDFAALCPQVMNGEYEEGGSLIGGYYDITAGSLSQPAFDYLNAVAKGEIVSENLTPNSARQLLLRLAGNYNEVLSLTRSAAPIRNNAFVDNYTTYTIDASAYDPTNKRQMSYLCELFKYDSWCPYNAITLKNVTQAQLDALKTEADSSSDGRLKAIYEAAVNKHSGAK